MEDILKINEMQEYFDTETGDELSLWFGKYSCIVDGITVSLNNVPLLKNKNTKKIYFPDKTKLMIQYFVEEAKKNKKSGIELSPKAQVREMYDFAKEFNFLYSHIDYEYIPGLIRPWNIGFLTPVLFNIDVLNKYSQNPKYRLELFSSTYGTIEKIDEWSIQFGVNKNKKVIIWLGDIHSLPKNEKNYLLSENVESDHDIHSEFYNAQIAVQSANASIENRTFTLRKDISDLFLKMYAVPFNMLDGEVSEVIKNFDKPIFWEDKHISPVVEALNRIFVESINIKDIKSIIKNENTRIDFGKKGSLKIITEWFGDILNMPNHMAVMSPFYVLYDFRVMVCHLQSSDTKEEQRIKINERLNIDRNNESYEEVYDALFKSLENSLSIIHLFFQNIKN
ncbi:MAG: hypothetical protein WCK96_08935 [Methylococcales bacterium]